LIERFKKGTMNSPKIFESLKEEKHLLDEANSRNMLNVSSQNNRSASPHNNRSASPQNLSVAFPKLFQMSERSERFAARRNSNIIDLKQVKTNSRRRSSIQPKIESSSSFLSSLENNLLNNNESQRSRQKTADSFNDRASYQECMALKYIALFNISKYYLSL